MHKIFSIISARNFIRFTPKILFTPPKYRCLSKSQSLRARLVPSRFSVLPGEEEREANTRLNSLIEKNEIDNAFLLFQSMKETFGPSVISYNIILKGLTRRGEMDRAEILFKEMESSLKPDHYTYNTLLRGYLRKGNFYKTHDLYKKMLENNVSPSQVTLHILLDGYCKAEQIKFAETLFKDIEKKSIITYGSMIDGYIRVKQFRKALNVINLMREEKIYPNNMEGLGMCVKIFIRNKQTEEALEFIEEARRHRGKYMKPGDQMENSYEAMENEQLENEQQDENLIVKEQYDIARSGQLNFELNIVIYNMLISGFIDEGKFERAFDMLAQMGKENIEPTIVTFSIMIKGLLRLRQAEMAKTLWETFQRDFNLVPDAKLYARYLHGFIEMRLDNEIINILQMIEKEGYLRDERIATQVRRYLESGTPFVNEAWNCVQEYYQDVASYNALLKGLAKLGDMDVVKKRYEEMRRKNIKPNVETFNVMVNGYIKVGKVQNAKQVIREMLLNNIKPRYQTYNPLIGHYIVNQDYDKAWKILEKMKEHQILGNLLTKKFRLHILEHCGGVPPNEENGFSKDQVHLFPAALVTKGSKGWNPFGPPPEPNVPHPMWTNEASQSMHDESIKSLMDQEENNEDNLFEKAVQNNSM